MDGAVFLIVFLIIVVVAASGPRGDSAPPQPGQSFGSNPLEGPDESAHRNRIFIFMIFSSVCLMLTQTYDIVKTRDRSQGRDVEGIAESALR